MYICFKFSFFVHLSRQVIGTENKWGKIRQVYPPKNFLSLISLKVRDIIVLVNLF